MEASIEKASGKSTCRDCSIKKIKKGAKCLRISIYGAGGSETAFYCKKCMLVIFDDFIKLINSIDEDLE